MFSLTSGIKLAPLLVDIKADIKGFKNDMSKAAITGVGEAKKISKELANVTKVGENLSSVGTSLTKFISVPLIGVGVAASKVGMNFEAQMSRVKAISGATGEEFNKLEKQAVDLGASTAFSATEAAAGMENLASAGFTTTEIMSAMPGMLDLAASAGEDLANSADIAASTLRGFGLEAAQAGHVADVLAKNAADTNAAVSDTGEAMKYIAPIAHAMGLSLEEVTASIGLMANAGIKGSQAGTTLRSALSRLSDPSKEAAEKMDELAFKAFDSQGNLLSLKDIIDNLKIATQDLTMEQKQQAISTIFGQEAMSGMLSLVSAGPEELEKLTNSLKNSDGAAKEMAETMQDNAKSSIEEMFGSLETSAIKITKSLAPTIIKVADKVGELADKFSNLSEEQQENILKWTGVAIAAGPTLKIIGGGIQTFTSLKTVLGGTSKALGAMEKGTGIVSKLVAGLGTASSIAGGTTGVGGLMASLGGMAVAAAPFVAGAAVVGTAAYGIHKAMSQEVIPTVDLFADKVTYTSAIVNNEYGAMANQVKSNTVKISESTKDAVQAYMSMDDEVSKALYNQKVTSEIITEELSQNMISKFSNMAQTIKDGQSIKYKEMTSDLTNFFNDNSSLTEVKEAEILQRVTEKHQAQQAIVDETMSKITEIYTNAKNENRELKQSELDEVSRLQEQMRINAINSLSATEEEASVIRQRMKDYQGRLTAEMASDMIIKANEARDGEIRAANEKYEEVIRQASRLKEARYITEEEYNDMVNSAKDTRDEQIKKAREACEGIKDEISKATPGISKEVELQTGKIKTWYSRAWDSIAGFFSDLFSNNSRAIDEAGSVQNSYNRIGGNIMGSHYNGLSYVPVDGYTARLHKGERVLTAEENKNYTQGSNSNYNSGNTFIFNSPKAIDEIEATRQIRRLDREKEVLSW